MKLQVLVIAFYASVPAVSSPVIDTMPRIKLVPSISAAPTPTPSSNVTSSQWPSTFSDAFITPAPSPSADVSGGSCTPKSICFDGITCGQRYGGCYDKNYCDGNTSPYPIPPCTIGVADGLTRRNVVPVEEKRE
ncbi:hypothetical protein B0A50_01998 [Salinomyces thailandicus]|uniref:Chitin-binding type-1 domain-containing protein n=1 Tax=Salinomyces thailandicus TaxID=706561 RepID=A0A4U0U731_9PEZI|nr:hypothetical protein B0A50_01998 [Salinomyces thailandica]